MERVLFVNACVRPESRTRRLAQCVLDQLDGNVEEINLEKENIQPLSRETLEQRDAWVKAGDFSAPMFRYAHQLVEADTVVLAAPYWDLAFPASVKVFFEAVTISGLTFVYTPEGWPKGLCKAKRLIYVSTSGGSMEPFNFGFDYVKAMAQGFYGIPEILCFKAENLDIVGADVASIMAKAEQEIKEWQG